MKERGDRRRDSKQVCCPATMARASAMRALFGIRGPGVEAFVLPIVSRGVQTPPHPDNTTQTSQSSLAAGVLQSGGSFTPQSSASSQISLPDLHSSSSSSSFIIHSWIQQPPVNWS